MKKRILVLLSFLLLGGMSLGFVVRPGVFKSLFAPNPKPYNVVLIVVDALRADRLGCYGYDRSTSPEMDRLAARGTIFQYAFAPLPMTQPSFATLFTSLYPHSHGLKRNDMALSKKAITLAEILQEKGWETAGIIGASNLDSVFRLNQGFQFYDDSLGRKMNPEIKTIDHMKRWERRAEEVTSLAVQWLNRRDSKQNFFLFLHYYDPHKPYHPPAPFDTAYDRGTDEIGEWNALYDGEVAYTDQQVGIVLRKLKEMNILDRTLIIITSDHGEGLGDHSWLGHIWKIYDEAVRVPLIVAGPDIPAGNRYDGMVSHVDFTPSILDYLNIQSYPHFQGYSWTEALSTHKKIRDRILLEKARPPWNFKQLEPEWEKFPYSQWAIRTETEKFIWSSDMKHEYYDLKVDPKELNNLYSVQKERALNLFSRGFEYRTRYVQLPLAVKAVRKSGDNEPDEALRALGYIN